MRNIIYIGLSIFLLSFSWGCSSNGGGTGVSNPPSVTSGLNLANAAVQSTPLISESLVSENISTLLFAKNTKQLSSESSGVIEDFFKLECHNADGTFSFCPDDVTEDLDNKFSLTSLIGLIYHSDIYLGEIYRMEDVADSETGEPTYMTCERGSPSGELINHTPVFSPSDADKFFVEFGTLCECFGVVGDWGGAVDYGLYSKATDNLTFAAAVSRKQAVGIESYVGIASHIFQSYLRKDDSGDPIMLGFNVASYDDKESGDYSGRALLLSNIAANKFIVKYISGVEEISRNHIAAIGLAGYDPDTSEWVDGYYMVKAKFGTEDEDTICIQNGETPAVVDDSNCSDISGSFSETGWTTSELYTWLEASETDQTNLAGFNSFFDNDNFLTTDELPQNNSDYFPDSISN